MSLLLKRWWYFHHLFQFNIAPRTVTVLYWKKNGGSTFFKRHKKIHMRIIRLLFILITLTVFTGYTGAQEMTLNGITYSVDTLENHQVGPATQYVSMRLRATGRRLDIFFLKTDVSNPYVEIRTALGKDSIYTGEPTSVLGKRKSTEGAYYFAGTNGDFYATSGYVGYPTGGNMVDGEIAKIPTARAVFTFSDMKVPNIGVATYSGTIERGDDIWTINSVNHLRGTDQLVLYNQLNGKRTRTNEHGTEVLIQLLPGNSWGTNKTLKAKVMAIEKNIGSMAIPKGQAVLSGHGTAATALNNLAVNDEIDINLNIKINGDTQANQLQMTGGDGYKPMLLNGVIETSNIWNELHPRTGLGYSMTGDTVIFCVVDGRGASNGVNTKQLAELMKSAGAWSAFNMDGGGSSTMYIDEYGKAVNATSDGPERSVSNSVFIVSTAPTDNQIGVIKPYKPNLILPKYAEFIPQFYGYNQYEVLLDNDLQGVELTCPESLGRIEGNKFIATGSTPGQITANYMGSTTTINVSFVNVDSIKIRLDSVIVDNRTTYPVEVIGHTKHNDALLSPVALDWTVEDENICIVENGAVKALSNGSTVISGTIDGITEHLLVKVEIPESGAIVGDELKHDEWTLSFSSQYKNKAELNEENLPEGWTHGSAINFTHAAGRSPYLELAKETVLYGLPDTVKVVMNIGDMEIIEAVVSMRANQGSTVTTKFESFTKNQDFSLDIPVSSILDTEDRGIYPIWFEKIRFFLNASGLTANKDYILAMKELTLCYDGVEISQLIQTERNFFEVFPNPVSNGELFIKLDNNDQSPIAVSIYDASGRIVKTQRVNQLSTGTINLSIQDIQAGIYYLQVEQNNKTNGVKLLVK